MKKKLLFALFFWVVVSVSGSNAQSYKWVDDQGDVHFSDSPPPQGTHASVDVESHSTHEAKPHNTLPSAQETPTPPLTPDLEKRPKKNLQDIKVELYVTSWCPYCKDARDFFLSRGIPFAEFNIEKDEDAARRKNELDGGRGVPFVVICDQPIRGFSTVAYERALALCGE